MNIRPCPSCGHTPKLVNVGDDWYVDDPCEDHLDIASSSKGAIYLYNKLCDDTDFILSLEAWHTRPWLQKVRDFIARKPAPKIWYDEW